MTDSLRRLISALHAWITALRTRIIPQLPRPQTDLRMTSGSPSFGACMGVSLALYLAAGPGVLQVIGLALALRALGRQGG